MVMINIIIMIAIIVSMIVIIILRFLGIVLLLEFILFDCLRLFFIFLTGSLIVAIM